MQQQRDAMNKNRVMEVIEMHVNDNFDPKLSKTALYTGMAIRMVGTVGLVTSPIIGGTIIYAAAQALAMKIESNAWARQRQQRPDELRNAVESAYYIG